MSDSITKIMTTIAEWSNGESEGGDGHLAEYLMMTEGGKLYLCYMGMDMNLFSESPDGVLVKSLTKAQAKTWAVSRGLTEAVEKCFSDVA